MWMLKLKGGLVISEATAGGWDSVPRGVEIESIGFMVPRASGGFFVMDFNGFDAYCIARVGASVQGWLSSLVGYCFYGELGDRVTELEMTDAGMKIRGYHKGKCELPEQCWRRGVS